MCDRKQLVPIPDFLRPRVDFDTGHPEFGIDGEGRECFVLDACIAPVLETLWSYGVETTGCCCGHGSGRGVVVFRTEKG